MDDQLAVKAQHSPGFTERMCELPRLEVLNQIKH
jgi:hypothetical protein